MSAYATKPALHGRPHPCARTLIARIHVIARPQAAMVYRSDGNPCHGHPLDRSKSDQALAGLLAHGSSRDVLPSQTYYFRPSGGSLFQKQGPCTSHSPLTVAGTAPDLTRVRGSHRVPILSPFGHQRDQSWGNLIPHAAALKAKISACQLWFLVA